MIQPSHLKRTAEWSLPDILLSIAASDDASRVWLGSSDANVYEMDLTAEKPHESRTPLQGEGHTSYVTAMVRAENTLVTCGYDRRLIWWDLSSRQQLRSVIGHDKWIRKLCITPDSSRLFSVADDMRIRVWDLETGNRIADFSDHAPQTPHHYPSMLYAVAVSADGSRLATGDRIGHVAIWDTTTFQKVGELETPVMYTWDPKQRRHSIGGIRSLAFSNDGSKLAVGGIGTIGNIDHLGGPARLEIFDVASGDRLHELEDEKKKGLIEQIVFAPDDQWILTCGGDNKGFMTIYETATGKLQHQSEDKEHIHAICYDKNFQNIFVAAHHRVSRWTMNEG